MKKPSFTNKSLCRYLDFTFQFPAIFTSIAESIYRLEGLVPVVLSPQQYMECLAYDHNLDQKKAVETALMRDFHYAFGESMNGGVPRVKINSLGKTEEKSGYVVGGVDWVLLPVMHANMEVYGFRVGDFAYITDVNFIPEDTFKKLNGINVLVISALRKKQHPSHFTLNEVLKVVERVKPEATYLTHLSHDIGKHEDLERELPNGVFVGFDGLIIENI